MPNKSHTDRSAAEHGVHQDWDRQRLANAVRQKLESLARSGVQVIARPPKIEPAAAEHLAKPTLPNTPAPAPSAARQPPVSKKPQFAGGGAEVKKTTVSAAAKTAANERPPALERLRNHVAICTRCPELAESRRQTVFGVGNPNARLCFFGEAPGADEDRLGEPFVGRAGELLDKILAACTLRREDVFILNVLKCRPPGNRDPLPDEIANCRHYFEEQFEIIQPEFICCLGRVAAQTLLRTTQPLGRLRGRFHNYGDSRVIVTYHPASLLRNPQQKRATWEDMKMLMAAMGIDVSQR